MSHFLSAVEKIIVETLVEADPEEFGSDEVNGGKTRAAALAKAIATKLQATGALQET